MKFIVHFEDGQYAGQTRAWPEHPRARIEVPVMRPIRCYSAETPYPDPIDFETDFYEYERGYTQHDEVHLVYRWVRPDTASMRREIRDLRDQRARDQRTIREVRRIVQ